MLKLKRPGLGFMFIILSLGCSIAALCLYLSTYEIGGYTINRWALTCSVLSIWFLVFLAGNILFKGDKQFWCSIIYVLIALLTTFALLQFIQPCITPIGFVFGASDLNMGDTALNELVAYRSVTTAVFYILSVLFVIVAAVLPAEWSFTKKKDKEVTV